MVAITVLVAALMTETVLEFELVTYTRVPSGVTAGPIGGFRRE